MNAKDVIANSLDFGDQITKAYISDLSAADLLIRPVPGQNHIAWQIGHLLLTEKNFLDGIKPGASPALPADFEEGHGRQQTKIDDPSKYRGPQDYLALRAAQRAATKSVLAGLSDAELDAPSPEGVRKMAPTVGAVFGLLASHDLMHVGQYVAVRRKLQKPVTI